MSANENTEGRPFGHYDPEKVINQVCAERERYRKAALRLRRFMDAYFTQDNITEEAGNVLGETAWIEGPR